MRDSISVAKGPPGPSNQAGDTDGFATSKKVKRTPPQPHAHPTLPGAPTKPARENSNSTDARNPASEDKDNQGIKPMEAEKPTTITQALRNTKARVGAFNPQGRNVDLKTEILSVIDEAINMAVEQEHARSDERNARSDERNEEVTGGETPLRKSVTLKNLPIRERWYQNFLANSRRGLWFREGPRELFTSDPRI
jgi:hypothetical protein